MYLYEIRVEGQLGARWSAWFEGLAICDDDRGGTVLRGPLPDQAALFGLLTKIQALNLTLLAVRRISQCEEP